MATIRSRTSRSLNEKPYGLSRRIWGAIIAAVIALLVKNMWEFVTYQVWMKEQILLLNQEQVEIHVQMDAVQEVHNREHAAIDHRIDLLNEDVRESKRKER